MHMALKSREMKKLKDFQKRKYGTPPSVLGIHGKRKDHLAKELNSYLIPNELAVRGETDENDTVDEVAETINETDLFTVGEFALFQFEALMVSTLTSSESRNLSKERS